MFKYERGEVAEVNVGDHQVKVKFPSQGDVVSPWLDVLVSSTSGDKEFRLPAVGNQVACLLDEHGESGCVLGAVYSSADPVPDGATEGVRLVELAGGNQVVFREAGKSPEYVALANLVADEFARTNQDIDTLKTAIGAGFTAVGVATSANGPAGKTAFDTGASSIPSARGAVAASALKVT